MLGVMVDGLESGHRFRVFRRFLTRVGIAVKPGKVAARHLQAHPVSFQEDVAGGNHVDVIFVHRSRFNRGWAVGRQPVPGPDDAVGQVAGATARGHVHQLGGEVGVAAGGGCVTGTG